MGFTLIVGFASCWTEPSCSSMPMRLASVIFPLICPAFANFFLDFFSIFPLVLLPYLDDSVLQEHGFLWFDEFDGSDCEWVVKGSRFTSGDRFFCQNLVDHLVFHVLDLPIVAGFCPYSFFSACFWALCCLAFRFCIVLLSIFCIFFRV